MVKKKVNTSTSISRSKGDSRETINLWLWPAQQGRINIVPAALGDLSQAIGAALVALYQSRS